MVPLVAHHIQLSSTAPAQLKMENSRDQSVQISLITSCVCTAFVTGTHPHSDHRYSETCI